MPPTTEGNRERGAVPLPRFLFRFWRPNATDRSSRLLSRPHVAGLAPTLFIGTLADRIGIPRVILLIASGVAVTGGLGTYFALIKGNQPESRGNNQ